jgi:hypothetical protein
MVFTVRPLSGMKAVTFLPRLNKVLGPALAALSAARSGLDADALKGALEALGDRLDEKEMEGITRTLLADATFQPLDSSKPGGELMRAFDQVFAGRAELVFQLLAFALEVNYAGFFPALKGLGARLKAPDSTSLRPKPTPGPVGV